MILRRTLLLATLVLLAVLIEVSVLAPFPWWGATPPLGLVTVAAVAYVYGAVTGASVGFAMGLLLDLAPPAEGTIGITALVLTLFGYALGRVFGSDERPWLVTTGLTAAAGGLAVLAGAALGGLLGDPRVRWDEVPSMVVAAAVYAGVLSLVVVPFVRGISRRVVPEAFPR
jgi:rod shape-determining protein MreD